MKTQTPNRAASLMLNLYQMVGRLPAYDPQPTLKRLGNRSQLICGESTNAQETEV